MLSKINDRNEKSHLFGKIVNLTAHDSVRFSLKFYSVLYPLNDFTAIGFWAIINNNAAIRVTYARTHVFCMTGKFLDRKGSNRRISLHTLGVS